VKSKLDAAGLSSRIFVDIAPIRYARAATTCQAKFDGHALPVTPRLLRSTL
jgi:hypothetical protein